jgi:hypothetical protein
MSRTLGIRWTLLCTLSCVGLAHGNPNPYEVDPGIIIDGPDGP